MADRETEAVRVLRHQQVDQCALAHTRGTADDDGCADARQVHLGCWDKHNVGAYTQPQGGVRHSVENVCKCAIATLGGEKTAA